MNRSAPSTHLLALNVGVDRNVLESFCACGFQSEFRTILYRSYMSSLEYVIAFVVAFRLMLIVIWKT